MNKKWLLFPLLFFLPACSSINHSFYQARALHQNEMVDNVKIGDKITVEPKTLSYDGQSKVVNGQIILPDGTSKAGDNFIIEMPGIYTVEYRAFFGVHEEKVSIFYHCHRTSGDFFQTSNKNNPAQTGEYSHPISNGSIQGAKLILDSKTVFTYDGIIDFTSFDVNNSFIDFTIDTSKQNTSDIETFTVRLTDVDDNNNYVDITVTDSGPVDDDGRGCYILAGSNSQFKTGFEGGRNGTLHISKYGANVGMSFRDLPEKGAKIAHLFFDYQNKALYAQPMINSGIKDIITDLDDKEIYGSTIWDGFKNGKATISIFANSLLSTSATLIVSKIAGVDLSPLDFVDTLAPTINVDYKGQSFSKVPKASVNKPYRIFDAEVVDNYDRFLTYSTYVTYEDKENKQTKDISIIDGCFTPEKEGHYIINYVAKDHSNNTATKTVDVSAINDSQEMTITLDEDTIFGELYSKINLPSFETVKEKISGGSGTPTLERSVYDKNNNLIEVEGDSFIPERIGEYKVYYKATDYISNVTTSILTVHVTDPGHPVFVDELPLPRIVIKGHTYTLPASMGAEVRNGETVYLDSNIYVNDALIEDGAFVAGDTCVIKYKLSGQSGTTESTHNIDVVNCDNPVHLDKYFVDVDSDIFSEKVVNKSDVTLSLDSGNAHALFASVLPYDNPFVKFSIDRDSIKCEEIIFKFSDSLNENNSLSFHVKFKLDKTYVSIGDNKEEFIFNSVKEEGSDSFAIDFSNANRVLKDVLHKEVEIVKYNDQGQLFTGFNDGVYLDIYMKGAIAESSMKILTISNQVFGDLGTGNYTDFANPIIIFNHAFISEQSYNEQGYIPSVQVFDVLSDAYVKVTVIAPDGTFKVSSEDGLKSHSFLLDQFGTYIVTYRGSDSEGNSVSYPRSITVYDYIAPEITITGKLKETYKLNASVKIPAYTISDNLNDYTLDIFLLMPDNQERLLLIDKNGEVTSFLEKDNPVYNSSFKVNSTTFKVEQTGHYILRYVAYDSDFNKVVEELHFDVK